MFKGINEYLNELILLFEKEGEIRHDEKLRLEALLIRIQRTGDGEDKAGAVIATLKDLAEDPQCRVMFPDPRGILEKIKQDQAAEKITEETIEALTKLAINALKRSIEATRRELRLVNSFLKTNRNE